LRPHRAISPFNIQTAGVASIDRSSSSTSINRKSITAFKHGKEESKDQEFIVVADDEKTGERGKVVTILPPWYPPPDCSSVAPNFDFK
jgi:hypothetical protein